MHLVPITKRQRAGPPEPITGIRSERLRVLKDGNRESTGPLHVGLVVDTARRAASVRRHVDDPKTYTTSVHVWVTTEPALAADPYGCVWGSASGEEVRTVDLGPHWTGDPWSILRPLCLAEPDNLEGLDERVIGSVPLLREAARF